MGLETEAVIATHSIETSNQERLMEAMRNREAELRKERVFRINGNTVLIEITSQCRTGCPYCYTEGMAHLHGEHLSMADIEARIDWAKRFTDVHTVTLLGGEPLLHPQLPQIIRMIIDKGLRPDVITSGVISAQSESEKATLVELLNLYEVGDVDIELSYHPDRNRKAYARVYREVRNRAPKRLANLKARLEVVKAQEKAGLELGEFNPELVDTLIDLKHRRKQLEGAITDRALFSTVTLGPNLALDEAKFTASIIDFLTSGDASNSDISTIEYNGSKYKVSEFPAVAFKNFVKHYSAYDESVPFNEVFYREWSGDKEVIFRFRLWGAVQVDTQVVDGHRHVTVVRPQGSKENKQVCPAKKVKYDKGSLETDALLIRQRDGEVVFPQPGCIEVKQGITNIKYADQQHVNETALFSLRRIKWLVKKINEHYRPNYDKATCNGCPLDKSCSACHNFSRPETLPERLPWAKAVPPATTETTEVAK